MWAFQMLLAQARPRMIQHLSSYPTLTNLCNSTLTITRLQPEIQACDTRPSPRERAGSGHETRLLDGGTVIPMVVATIPPPTRRKASKVMIPAENIDNKIMSRIISCGLHAVMVSSTHNRGYIL